MKKALKKIIPVSWLNYYRSLTIPKRKSQFEGHDIKTTFTEIYKSNLWKGKESISGPGSDTIQTHILAKELEKLFSRFQIKSILDVPCGDFLWMSQINLNGINYIGGDIVNELIQRNKTLHAEKPNIKFDVIDITQDPLPSVDLLICRDCLVHFSYKDLFQTISNFKKSNIRYILTTSFPNHPINYDIPTGEWRTLHLGKAPFYFPKPILIINENCTEGDGEYKDKSLFLWEIKNIKSS
jgi:hypothetical protein